MSQPLQGRIALVTGAGKNIGRGIAPRGVHRGDSTIGADPYSGNE